MNKGNVTDIQTFSSDVDDRNFFMMIGIGVVAGLVLILLIMVITLLFVRRYWKFHLWPITGLFDILF